MNNNSSLHFPSFSTSGENAFSSPFTITDTLATPFVNISSSSSLSNSSIPPYSTSSNTNSNATTSFTPAWIKSQLETYTQIDDEYNIVVHYITSITESESALFQLSQPSLLPSASFVTLHFSYDPIQHLLFSFTLCVKHQDGSYHLYLWDFQHCPDQATVKQCQHHCQALFHIPGLLHIVFDIQGCHALFEGIGLDFFDQLICAQTFFQEWDDLSTLVLKMILKLPQPQKKKPMLASCIVPEELHKNHIQDSFKSKNFFTFPNLIKACGLTKYSESSMGHDPSKLKNTPLEPCITSLLHTFLLSLTYVHMTRALGRLQGKYLEYISYDDFYNTDVIEPSKLTHPPLDLLTFLYHTLKEKGAMSVPDLSLEVQSWASNTAKQQFSEAAGIKGLMETFPEYLMYEKKSIRELYIDRARLVQWNPSAVLPIIATTTTTTTTTNNNNNKNNTTNTNTTATCSATPINPFLPFGPQKTTESALFITLQMLNELA